MSLKQQKCSNVLLKCIDQGQFFRFNIRRSNEKWGGNFVLISEKVHIVFGYHTYFPPVLSPKSLFIYFSPIPPEPLISVEKAQLYITKNLECSFHPPPTIPASRLRLLIIFAKFLCISSFLRSAFCIFPTCTTP